MLELYDKKRSAIEDCHSSSPKSPSQKIELIPEEIEDLGAQQNLQWDFALQAELVYCSACFLSLHFLWIGWVLYILHFAKQTGASIYSYTYSPYKNHMFVVSYHVWQPQKHFGDMDRGDPSHFKRKFAGNTCG